jgi:hypothetical protein
MPLPGGVGPLVVVRLDSSYRRRMADSTLILGLAGIGGTTLAALGQPAVSALLDRHKREDETNRERLPRATRRPG